MILHSYYKDDLGNKVYLESESADRVFYRVGKDLVTATVEFFMSKYKLGF